MADRLGRTEFDRRKKSEADLMELMERVAREREEARLKAEMHPLEMEAKKAQTKESQVRAQKGEHDLSLDQIYGARQREANIDQTTSSTASNRQSLIKKQGDDFLDAVGRIVNSGQVMTPEQIRATAAQFQLPPNHPLVLALEQLDPAMQKKAIGGMQVGGTSNMEQRSREEAIANRQMAVENERTKRAMAIAQAREAGRMAAAASKGAADPKSIPAKLIQLKQRYDAATDDVEKSRIAGEFEMWQQIWQESRVQTQPGMGVTLGADGKPVISPARTPQQVPINRNGPQHSLTPMVPQPEYATNPQTGDRLVSRDGGKTWSPAPAR
jgi:hypothetical protein